MKTKTQKAIALFSIVGILFLNVGNAFAEVIGQGIVSNTAGNTAINTPVDINKEGSSASGSISGVKVTANVGPVLSLTIDKAIVDLGNISGFTKNGSFKIEVGTNAPTGLTVTATSTYGGLKHETEADLVNSNANGAAYIFQSKDGGGTNDFSTAYTRTFISGGYADITTTNPHVIYTTNKGEKHSNEIDDIEFIVSATAGSSGLRDGNYEDLITFAIAASF